MVREHRVRVRSRAQTPGGSQPLPEHPVFRACLLGTPPTPGMGAGEQGGLEGGGTLRLCKVSRMVDIRGL